ncbi:MAG: signal peptidase I [Nitrososphaeria archaeon]|nr:signal peptidase I [Conexivisphaerales archaeon]
MKNRYSRIFLYVSSGLFALYVFLLLLNYLRYAFPVEGVSMEPVLWTGYLAFVEPATISQLAPNSSIIVYHNPFYRELVIHMVIKKIDDYAVIVKGVNRITNPFPDLNYTSGAPLLVTQNMIVGKVIFWIPYLGYVLLYPYNYIIIILFMVSIIINAFDK